MATRTELQLVISAKNEASKSLKSVQNDLSNLSKTKAFSILKASAKATAVAFGAVATSAVIMGKKSVQASVEMENAMVGLKTVARAFNQDIDKTTQVARRLASDGLLTVKEAANGLKNLLGAGFGLDEATKLMEGFKDSASFNRQGMLSLGQAVEGATQGIKNQNSILVDNAGITKNLSIIMKEQGLSVQDLASVQSDANVRAKLYNGLLQEMAVFQGDAEKATNTLGGQISKTSATMFEFKALIGDALAPLVIELNKGLQELANRFIVVREDGVKELTPEMQEFIDTMVRDLMPVLKDSIDFIVENREVFLQLAKAVSWVVKTIIEFFKKLSRALENAFFVMFRTIWKAEEMWEDLRDTVEDTVKDISRSWNKLRDTLSKPIKSVVQVTKKIKEKIKGDQFGGAVQGGKPVIVGEHRPEVFVPHQSGNIRQVGQGTGGGEVNVNFNNVSVRNDNDLEMIISEVKRVLQRDDAFAKFGIRT